MKDSRYCVIMCGGIGSRFWPFSRQDRPKQFLDFFGTGRSLLQMTVDRIAPVVGLDHIVLVTNDRYADTVRRQVPEIAPERILCEPARRNTAPCVCWATRHIAALDPEASIVTLPSDHMVLREDDFRKAISEGFDFIEGADRLLTLGIKPTFPNTGYGYIQRGNAVKGWPGIMKVKSFTEKPDLEMAKLFLNSGEFFWNSGIFLWSARSILKAFDKYAPEISTIFAEGADTFGTPEEKDFIEEVFSNAPSISVDYAIMEKADNVFVKTVEFGWSDLGTWRALHDTASHTEDNNIMRGARIMTRDCSGTVFAADDDKLIVAAGLHDYVVADSGNALLIYPLSREQELRSIVGDVRDKWGEDYI